MYDSILYPTDGSQAAQAAVEHARTQAEQFDASLHVLYVVDMEHAGVGLASDLDIESSQGMVGSPAGSGTGMVGTRQGKEPDSDLKSQGTDIVEQVAEQFEGLEVQTAVRARVPYEPILEYAEEAGSDMIVMSTHGRSGLDRYLIGSVTEKVVRSSNIPVLTVRAGDS